MLDHGARRSALDLIADLEVDAVDQAGWFPCPGLLRRTGIPGKATMIARDFAEVFIPAKSDPRIG
ncbi:MAG: hypothetical protein ACXW4U_15750 [Anaerolineales bacterium]